MNNADFKALLQGSGGVDNTRFDLSQVEKWDRENRTKQKKSEKFAQKKRKNNEERHETHDDELASKYRNRAEERRKGDNPDYDESLEKIVAEDAEKSKYLGGDEKYTHLVRGLDHALLAKVRRELQEAKQQNQSGNSSTTDSTTYTPHTTIGKSLKLALFSSNPASHKQAHSSADFNRISFEYNVDAPLEEGHELPMTSLRSKIELSAEERLANYSIPSRLAERIANVLALKVLNKTLKKKRKKGDDEENDIIHEAPAPRPTITSIFDDDIGVYVPPGALTNETQSTASASGMEAQTKKSSGYFSGLTASSQEQKMDLEGPPQLPQHMTDEEMTEEQKAQLKKSLLPFHSMLRQSKPVVSSAASADEDGLEGIRQQIEERKRAAAAAKLGKDGKFMAKFNDYDGIYPDTAELGFTYDSDEEDGGKKRKKGAADEEEKPQARSMAPDEF